MILARGQFHPDNQWTWGFTAERTSDPLIFDKYDIGKVYETRGPYVADDRRLISQLYAIRQDRKSYFSIAAMDVQGDEEERLMAQLKPVERKQLDGLLHRLLLAAEHPESP